MQTQGFIAEEAERLYAWCLDFGEMTLKDAAECVNESRICEDYLSPSAMLHIAVTWIYVRYVNFDSELWPAGTEPRTLRDLPHWVRANWDQYYAYQLTGGIYEDEVQAQAEDDFPF